MNFKKTLYVASNIAIQDDPVCDYLEFCTRWVSQGGNFEAWSCKILHDQVDIISVKSTQ